MSDGADLDRARSEGMNGASDRRSLLSQFIRSSRTAVVAVALASALVNLLYLTGAIYMMEVYDRVLASRSLPTLVGLSILAATLFAFQGLLDLLRGRILIRISRLVTDGLALPLYRQIGRMALLPAQAADRLQPIRDLDQVRGFLSGPGPLALLDLPWLPFYLGACFLLHFWIGVTALMGACVLLALALATEALTRSATSRATALASKRNALAGSWVRNAEVLHAMGMTSRLSARWIDVSEKLGDAQQRTSDVGGGLGSASKIVRLALQSAVLGVGAYLVINQQASAGVIIAGSIISGRALAPVDQAIANWRGFVAFRQSWRRLRGLLQAARQQGRVTSLPVPCASYSVEGISVVPSGGTKPVVQAMSFRLEKGSALGVIGPSGAGKSCLARALVGLWSPIEGTIRIDGAALDQWEPERLGRYIGYLPQNVELLDGTIAENIARFDPEPDAADIVAAAKAADVHELILRLPQGYDSQIGDNGALLSAGQRQRVALARALYRNPFLLVLDEPNSNLDSDGDRALTHAIAAARARGAILVIIAHRQSVLASVDLLMTMVDGKLHMFGPTDDVLAKLRPPSPPVPRPLRIVETEEIAS